MVVFEVIAGMAGRKVLVIFWSFLHLNISILNVWKVLKLLKKEIRRNLSRIYSSFVYREVLENL